MLFPNIAQNPHRASVKFQKLLYFYKYLITRLLLIVIVSLPFGEGWGGASYAQDAQAKIDSLLSVLKTAKEDTNKVNTLLELGREYNNSNNAKMMEYIRQALPLALKLNHSASLPRIYAHLGTHYTRLGDFSQALDYGLKALKIAEKLKNKRLIAGSHNQLFILYSSIPNYPLAKSHLLKGMALTDSTDISRIATGYNNLADLYVRQNDSLDQAMIAIDKAISLAKKANLKVDHATFTITKGEIYALQKKYSEALVILFESMKLNEEVEAVDNYPYIYNVIAEIYGKQGENAKALEYYQKALKTSTGEKEVLLHTYEGLLNAYIKQNDYKKAFEFQKNYHALKDSIYNEENKGKTEAMRLNYDLEKQNDKIALLEKDKNLQAARNERFMAIIILGIFVLIGVLIFSIYMARLHQKQKQTNRQLQEKNEEVAQQAEELHQQAEELAAQRDNLEKANENVMLLSEIGKEITSTLKVEQIIEIAYEKVNALMDATVFMIGIFNEAKQQIEMPIIKEKGITHPFLSYHLSETERPAVWCFTHQKELVWNDVYADYPKYFNGKTLPPVKSGDQTNSLIYMPLMSNGRAIGVVSVQSFQKDAYSDYQVHMLRNIAIYTTIAVENAENLMQLDTEKKNLESTNQELEALTEELRQQSDMVQAQRDQLTESSTQLEELLEESQSQKEILEIRNQEMEALQTTKDLMISAVNHDLRNPLNPILNYSQADYPKFTEKERLAMIHDRAKMMFALINDIMDVYRADKMQLQPQSASLYKAVNEAITAISESKNDLPEIINQVPENAQAVFEYKYIERVFENLLSNAVKYSENQTNGGKIIFYTEIITDKQGKKYHRIAIKDNGMGIPKEKFEEIFLPFSNPNAKNIGAAKSVGIGLTFCKTIVEAHGSQILIESEVGKGTTFAFDLEMVEENIAKSSESQNKGELSLTDSEKAYLQDFIPQLAVFQDELFNADVRKILKNIEANGNENIKLWKQSLEQSIDDMDEDKFKELLELTRN